MFLKSRFVVPVDSPFIEDGAVVVRDGKIASVGPADDLSDDTVVDYGDAVICPGFVNAHTHLELSLLAGRVPPTGDFTDWLRRLFCISTSPPPAREQVHEAMRIGIERSLAAGVTTVADITSLPKWTRGILAGSVLRGVSFGEVVAIGKRRHLLADRLSAAASTEHKSDRMCIGISPHAPYTVEPDAMRACSRRADEIAAPLCIHLAETADEETFTRTGTGPFADYLRDLGIWDDDIPVGGCGPVELARRTGLLRPTALIAHANYVKDDDIELIAESKVSVAYCPRTHRAFGHSPHRFRDMLARGINVCVGTDSLASNPSLSILDELRFLRREHADLTPSSIIELGTLSGARALGFADTSGSITVGKVADLVVAPLGASGSAARWESILESEQTPAAVYVAGVLQQPGGDGWWRA